MPKLYAGNGGVSREIVDQAVTKIVPVIVPVIVPKATDTSDTSETFQGISSDIVPNVYKGFGANPRQDWVQEKGGVRLRNPVLYPPELQGQKTPKAAPAKSLQWSRRISLHGQSARLPPKGRNGPQNGPLWGLQSTLKRRTTSDEGLGRVARVAPRRRLLTTVPLRATTRRGPASFPPAKSDPACRR